MSEQVKHTPTPIIWVCTNCGQSYNKPNPFNSSNMCRGCENGQIVIPYIPQSTLDHITQQRDSLLEAAKNTLHLIKNIAVVGKEDSEWRDRISFELEQALKAAKGEDV